MAPSFFFDFKKKVLTYHKAGQGYAKTNTTRSNEGSIPHPPADSQPHPAECLSCGGVCNKGPLAGVHTMEPCRRAHRNGVIPIGTSIGEVTGLSPFELGLAREVPAPPSARGAETGPSVCSTADARTARLPCGVARFHFGTVPPGGSQLVAAALSSPRDCVGQIADIVPNCRSHRRATLPDTLARDVLHERPL